MARPRTAGEDNCRKLQTSIRMIIWSFMSGRLNEEGAYRIVVVDHAVSTRLVGPDGRQHKDLSRALTFVSERWAHSPDTARRYLFSFKGFLNTVEPGLQDAADVFVRSVADCRRTMERYLKAMKVVTRDLDGGAMWLVPKAGDHRRVADALVAIGQVTAALAGEVFGGRDPFKMDPEVSRVKNGGRTSLDRHGNYRKDTDRRLRMGADPTTMPRLDDPRVHELWQQALEAIGAPEPFRRIVAMLRKAGMRCFQALGLTLYDVFCLGGSRTLPVPDKGDPPGSYALSKKLPSEEWGSLFAYVDGERARVTGLSLRAIRLIAADQRRWSELQNMPLFTENGADPIEYDRLYRVTNRAAKKANLYFTDEDGTRRIVNLHLLRHEYVHQRLDEIDEMEEWSKGRALQALIKYLGWSGEAMLKWYSAHQRIKGVGTAASEYNRRLASRDAQVSEPFSGDAWEAGMARASGILASL